MHLDSNVVDAYLQSKHGFGLGRYQIRILQVLFLVAFNSGNQRSLSMIIEPYILLSQTNLIDFYDFGVLVASLCMGLLADFRGRVPLLKIAIIGQSIMCLFQNAVLSLGIFALMQMIQGILSAIILQTSFILYVESVHHFTRDTAFAFGQIYGVVIASILQSTTSNQQWWVLQFFFSALPCIVSVILVYKFFKESPFYLLSKQQTPQLNEFINNIQRMEEDDNQNLIREIKFKETKCINNENHSIWEVLSTTKFQGASQILFIIWFILEFIFRGTLTILPWLGGVAQKYQIINVIQFSPKHYKNFKYTVMYEISGSVPAFMISLFIIKQFERKYFVIATFLVLAIFQLTTNFNNYFIALWVIVTNNMCNFLLPVITLQTLELFPTSLRATLFGLSQVCRSATALLMYMCVNLIYNMTLNMPFSLFTILSIACMLLGFLFKDNSKDLPLDYMLIFKEVEYPDPTKYVEMSQFNGSSGSRSIIQVKKSKRKQNRSNLMEDFENPSILEHDNYLQAIKKPQVVDDRQKIELLKEKISKLSAKYNIQNN